MCFKSASISSAIFERQHFKNWEILRDVFWKIHFKIYFALNWNTNVDSPSTILCKTNNCSICFLRTLSTHSTPLGLQVQDVTRTLRSRFIIIKIPVMTDITNIPKKSSGLHSKFGQCLFKTTVKINVQWCEPSLKAKPKSFNKDFYCGKFWLISSCFCYPGNQNGHKISQFKLNIETSRRLKA